MSTFDDMAAAELASRNSATTPTQDAAPASSFDQMASAELANRQQNPSPVDAPAPVLPNGQPTTGNPDIDAAIRRAYTPPNQGKDLVGRAGNAVDRGIGFALDLPDRIGRELGDWAISPTQRPAASPLPSGVRGLDPSSQAAIENAFRPTGGMNSPVAATALRVLPTAAAMFMGGGEGRLGEVGEPNIPNAPTGSPQSISAAAAGPNIGSASPELQAAITRATNRNGGGINPDALSRHFEAESLPVKIQLTAGQATQDPVALSKEMNMRGAQPALADRLNKQNGQLIDNLQTMRDTAGPEVFSTTPVEHGETLIDAYQAKDAAAQADISAKYKALKDANGGQFPVDARGLLDNASAALHQQLLFDHAPREIMSTLGRLADANSMTFENYESLRTNLARIQRSMSADGNTKAAAGVIRDAMEQLPLAPGAAQLKPLADAARGAARTQFAALEADPAYKAAVNETVSPDRFVSRFVTNAPRGDVATMARNFSGNPTAQQTLSVAALDHLRAAARISPEWQGNFASASYLKALQALGPKLGSLVKPQLAEQLNTLGNVARYTQFQPAGSFVNNSNTFVAGAAQYGAGALEGAANVAAHGIPIGTWARRGAQHVMQGRQVQQALAPGAGIGLMNSPRGGGLLSTP